MKILKRLLLGVICLIALLLIVALFVNKDYKIEREITINKPEQPVFEYLKSLQNQKNWSTWSSMDPKMTDEMKGTDATVGAVWSWKSKVMGDGEQKITKIIDNEQIDIDLTFFSPYKSTSPCWLKTEAVSEQSTKVKWGMTGHMDYPMNVMQLFVSMEKMIGTEYENSLKNLKGILEK
jgi:hypothetical protein